MSEIHIDPTLYTTAPTDNHRLAKEMRVYDLLDSLSIPFIRLDHEETATVESCVEIEKILNIQTCKNLFLCNSQKTEFYLLMLLGNKKFKSSTVAHQIHSSQLSFAKESYMEEYLDLTPGSVTVLGLMNDKNNNVQLLIDRDLLSDTYFGCHPCINTSSLKLKVADLMNTILPAIHHTPIIVELSSGQTISSNK